GHRDRRDRAPTTGNHLLPQGDALMKPLPFCTFLLGMGITLGCAGAEDPGISGSGGNCSISTSSATTSGAGGGLPECITMEAKEGVGFKDCTTKNMTVLRGTLDGKPFDQTFMNTGFHFDEQSMPGSAFSQLP